MKPELDASLLPAITLQRSVPVEKPVLQLDGSSPIASFTFLNQTKYCGEVTNNIPDKQGKISWVDQTTYTGEFSMGNMTGLGKIVWRNGCEYEGSFLNGLRHGRGKFVYNSADDDGLDPQIYDGEWIAGFRHGNGEMQYNDGSKYVGAWKNNRRHGHGKMTYNQGDVEYVGEWVDDVKCGDGEMNWRALCRVYKGQWRDNEANGQGEVVWLAQVEEEGSSESKADKKTLSIDGVDKTKTRDTADNIAPPKHDELGDGPGLVGIQKFNNYKGQLKNGERSGFGIMSFSNGSQYMYDVYCLCDGYRGEWLNDKRHGQGVVVNEDGSIHHVSHNDGVLHEQTGQSLTTANDSINPLISIDVDDIICPLINRVHLDNGSGMDKGIIIRDFKKCIQNKILQHTVDIKNVYKWHARMIDPTLEPKCSDKLWISHTDSSDKEESNHMILSVKMSSIWKLVCMSGLGHDRIHHIELLNIFFAQYIRNKCKIGLLDDASWAYDPSRRNVVNLLMNQHLLLNDFVELCVRVSLTVSADGADFAFQSLDTLPVIIGMRSVFDSLFSTSSSGFAAIPFWQAYHTPQVCHLIESNQERIISLMEECKGCCVRIFESLLQKHVMDSNDIVCWLWSSFMTLKQSKMTYPCNADLCCWLISVDVIVLQEAMNLSPDEKLIVVLEKVLYDENIAVSLPNNLRIGPRIGLIELSPDEFVETIAMTSVQFDQVNSMQIKTRLCECLGL